MRSRVFVDFWNFQLGWNEAAGRAAKCDWSKLPMALVKASDAMLADTGNPGGLTLEETIVHASVNDAREPKLREWLTGSLDRLPSFNVKIRDRRVYRRAVRCPSCGAFTTECASCKAPLMSSTEKGVDAALVMDLLSLAWQRAYDVAVLVSGDSDYIPAVGYVQSQGLKVINAAWAKHGHELQGACWGSFVLDRMIPALER